MNIKGRYYCSRCMKPISDEIPCPFCGHDPEEVFDSHLMEEGTLLSDQRYRVGVLIKEDDLFCYYGGWDYYREQPVIIKELFPKEILSRNILDSDHAVICPEAKQRYNEILCSFVFQQQQEQACVIREMLISDGFGYQILDYSLLPKLL